MKDGRHDILEAVLPRPVRGTGVVIVAPQARSLSDKLRRSWMGPSTGTHRQRRPLSYQTSGNARESNPPIRRSREDPSVLKTEVGTSPARASRGDVTPGAARRKAAVAKT